MRDVPIWCLSSLLLAALGAAIAAPEDPSVEVAVYASPTRIDRIGRVLAAVKINDKGPFKFIVDTGASHSTISPHLAAALGLDPAAEVRMRVNGITGTADVPSVTVHKLQAGDLVTEETRLPVLWAPLMAGADGILGVAGLKEETIFVDFRRNRVTISRSRGWGTPAGFSRVAGQRLEGGLLTVPARIGGIRVQAIIDTGSERTIGNTALRDALKGWRRGAPLREVTQVYGATIDVATGEMEVAPTMDLGSVRIIDVTIVYGDFHIFDVWGMRSRPAVIIGMDVLGTVSALGIDFRRSELYLEGLQYVSDTLHPQANHNCTTAHPCTARQAVDFTSCAAKAWMASCLPLPATTNSSSSTCARSSGVTLTADIPSGRCTAIASRPRARSRSAALKSEAVWPSAPSPRSPNPMRTPESNSAASCRS